MQRPPRARPDLCCTRTMGFEAVVFTSTTRLSSKARQHGHRWNGSRRSWTRPTPPLSQASSSNPLGRYAEAAPAFNFVSNSESLRGKASAARSRVITPPSGDWALEYRQAAWREGLRRLGLDDPTFAMRMSSTFIEAQRDGHRLIRGATPLARALARQSQLGLLTNGPSDIQRHKFARSGVVACFDSVVISGELGIGKPDDRAFSHVMERLATRAADMLMIGDSWERDVCGAMRAKSVCEKPVHPGFNR